MGNLASIVINDGQAAPVAHTFEVVGRDQSSSTEVFVFKDKVLGTAIAYPTLTLSLKVPSKTSRTYRMSGKVVVPALEAASGANINGFTPAATVAYTNVGSFEFVFNERATLAERKNLIAYVTNSLANALIKSMPQDYVNLY